MTADEDFEVVTLTQLPGADAASAASYLPSGFSGAAAAEKKRWEKFLSLIFRHSSCHHPLLAAAVAEIAATGIDGREAISRVEGALQQLLSMALSGHTHASNFGCATLALIAGDEAISLRLVESSALRTILALLGNGRPPAQARAGWGVGGSGPGGSGFPCGSGGQGRAATSLSPPAPPLTRR